MAIIAFKKSVPMMVFKSLKVFRRVRVEMPMPQHLTDNAAPSLVPVEKKGIDFDKKGTHLKALVKDAKSREVLTTETVLRKCSRQASERVRRRISFMRAQTGQIKAQNSPFR